MLFHSIQGAGGFSSGAPSGSLVYQGFSDKGGSTSSPATYTAQPIGTASSDRVVFVITWGLSITARSVTGMTIGGVTASLVVGNSSAGVQTLYMYRATVPSGTTADVVVTWSGSLNNTGIVIYTASGFGTITNNASNRVVDNNLTQSISLGTVANGFLLAASFRYRGATINVNSVSNYNLDREVEGGTAAWTYGNVVNTATETKTYSVTYSATSGSNGNTPFIVASFSY